MSARRHVRAIALLPGTVTVVVPAIILATGGGPEIGWGLHGLSRALLVLAGGALIAKRAVPRWVPRRTPWTPAA